MLACERCATAREAREARKPRRSFRVRRRDYYNNRHLSSLTLGARAWPRVNGGLSGPDGLTCLQQSRRISGKQPGCGGPKLQKGVDGQRADVFGNADRLCSRRQSQAWRLRSTHDPGLNGITGGTARGTRPDHRVTASHAAQWEAREQRYAPLPLAPAHPSTARWCWLQSLQAIIRRLAFSLKKTPGVVRSRESGCQIGAGD